MGKNVNLRETDIFLGKLTDDENAWDYFDKDIAAERRRDVWDQVKDIIREDDQIDRLVMDEFVEKYDGYIKGCVHGKFKGWLPEFSDREELIGDIWLKLLNPERFEEGEEGLCCGGIMTFKGNSRVTTWLFPIIKTVAKSKRVEKMNLRGLLEDDPAPGLSIFKLTTGPMQSMINKEVEETHRRLHELVREILDGYDKETQDFIYHYARAGKHGKSGGADGNNNVKKKSTAEIMELLGIDPAREREMRDRWNYFLKKLKKSMEDEGIRIRDLSEDRFRYVDLFSEPLGIYLTSSYFRKRRNK